ncbi:MAG: NAD(P)-dependent oxidoreductase [Bacilli bacterium]|nr:NAD(P)-dependent oxidoreductase [Bacilli bacterium]
MENNEKLIRYMSVLAYIKTHAAYWDEYVLGSMKGYAQRGIDKEVFFKDSIREVYDELGYIPDDQNMYISFLNLINQQFGLEGKNIVEVGGGTLPRLGRRIHLKQNTGTITVYDPRIGKDIKGEDRFVLKREEFTTKTPVKGVDLLIGLMPCKGAEPLIEQAIKHKIDFMVWLCEGGPHGDYFDYFEDEEEWIGSTIYTATRGIEDQRMGKLVKIKQEEFSKYPIIYNQR